MGKKKKGTPQPAVGTGPDDGEAGAVASGDAALVLSSDTTMCGQCGIRNSDLKSCGGCFQVAYCGKECQASGWKVHKKRCKEAGVKLALASLGLVMGKFNWVWQVVDTRTGYFAASANLYQLQYI